MAADSRNLPAATAQQAEIDAFLRQIATAPAPVSAGGSGRLIFALDATASRQPTWDKACHIQAEMFAETASLGGLALQMCYFRGFGEFEAAPWLSDGKALIARMTAVTCLSGRTQIARVLRHAIAEASKGRVNALVYVGDCMEEDADLLGDLAGKLGLLGVPVFIFQEGHEAAAKRAFQDIARVTRGAYMSFDSASAKALRDLLKAVAIYAAGGRKALARHAEKAGGEVLRLTRQLP
jgi:hypothetical protein